MARYTDEKCTMQASKLASGKTVRTFKTIIFTFTGPAKEGSMKTIRKEVYELISANEKIHSAIAQGERLTDDEKRLVEICASELIASMSNKRKRRFRDSDGARLQRGG